MALVDAKGLETFLDEYEENSEVRLMLYGSDEVVPPTKRILAVLWWKAL